jgi:hypothetical protein
MKEIAHEIRKTVREAADFLSAMDPVRSAFKENPEKWSRKEILGHLIDSAANNHQRFVRAGYNAAAGLTDFRTGVPSRCRDLNPILFNPDSCIIRAWEKPAGEGHSD